MNLKEAFRYQRFLDSTIRAAGSLIEDSSQCWKNIKVHKRHEVNPDTEDITETVERDYPFSNDTIIRLMQFLVNERQALCCSIDDAKIHVLEDDGFDIDAAIETNKFRQIMSSSIKTMLRKKPSDYVVQGTGFKFNNDGNQMPYHYDIEVSVVEDFDKQFAKNTMLNTIARADDISSQIDSAMINTNVDYTPLFDVNLSLEDVLTQFTAS